MKKISIYLVLSLVVTLSLMAGGKQEVEAEDGGSTLAMLEAPILGELVDAGELPPLAERMPVPSDIMVEPDVVELGEYGGSLTFSTHDGARWTWGPWTEQSMFRFKQDGSGQVEPNVAKDFYPNEDATVWTIELREGMRWSDGVPFTADDVLFYYNHMSTPALNPDRSPVGVDEEGYYGAFTRKPYQAYQVIVDDTPYWAEFEKIDDYTFTVTFAAPKPAFPEAVAIDNKWMFAAQHFYKDIVARKDGVTDDPDFPLITEEEALANANEIFDREWSNYSTMGKDTGYYHWEYYQVPQIRSFIATANNHDRVGEVYELVRNPYFFKTDSEGRQLPYLDSLRIEIINEVEQTVLKAVAGEFDVQVVAAGGNAANTVTAREFSTIASATRDTHKIKTWSNNLWSGFEVISLNQTVQDPDKRRLFQDVGFREALSIAVDRDLLNNTLANGQSEPWQTSVPPGIPGYDPEWSKKWTEFDQDRANQLLDEITEPWDRASGTFRKMEGTDKDVEIIVSLEEPSTEGDFFSLLRSAYAGVGVKLLERIEADLAQTILANEHEAELKGIKTSTPALRPDNVVPMRNFMSWYGAYGKWYEDGKSEANGGVAPTGDVLALVEAYEAIQVAVGPTRNQVVAENVQDIYDLHRENIWVIGYLRAPQTRYIVRNELHNWKDGLIETDEFRYVNFVRPEQLYFE